MGPMKKVSLRIFCVGAVLVLILTASAPLQTAAQTPAGNLLGKFGSAGKQPKEFGLVNSIDCRNENELLVGELSNWRVQKLTLRPQK